MLTLLEQFLMIGQATNAEAPVWAVLLAPMLMAAVVLRRTPRS